MILDMVHAHGDKAMIFDNGRLNDRLSLGTFLAVYGFLRVSHSLSVMSAAWSRSRHWSCRKRAGVSKLPSSGILDQSIHHFARHINCFILYPS